MAATGNIAVRLVAIDKGSAAIWGYVETSSGVYGVYFSSPGTLNTNTNAGIGQNISGTVTANSFNNFAVFARGDNGEYLELDEYT